MTAILVLVATIGTIAYNTLAGAGYVNDVTPAVISDRYPTVVTPAGYAFSIWSLIYLGLIAFSIYQLLPRNAARFRPIRRLYIISCVLNCAWIYFWHQGQIAICLAIILGLLVTLLFILKNAANDDQPGGALFAKVPFGIYAGWVTAASLVNFAILLRSSEVSISPTAWNVLGVALILLASGIAAIVRWKLTSYIFPMSVAWAATAIAVKQSGNTAIVAAAAVCVIICLILTLSFVMDQKTFDYESR
jgi:benzodiazapine receptor